MSTRKTRAFLEYYAKNAPNTPAAATAQEALVEVEAIEKAAKEFYLNGKDAHSETAWALMDTIGAEVVAQESAK
jgi:hypothetical protein